MFLGILLRSFLVTLVVSSVSFVMGTVVGYQHAQTLLHNKPQNLQRLQKLIRTSYLVACPLGFALLVLCSAWNFCSRRTLVLIVVPAAWLVHSMVAVRRLANAFTSPGNKIEYVWLGMAFGVVSALAGIELAEAALRGLGMN